MLLVLKGPAKAEKQIDEAGFAFWAGKDILGHGGVTRIYVLRGEGCNGNHWEV